MSDLTFLSATQMAEQIRLKRLSPVELVEAHLEKIARLNPRLNAFVQVNPERACHDARLAQDAVLRGEAVGPLHGVPISVKSSVDVAGMKVEVGHAPARWYAGGARCASG